MPGPIAVGHRSGGGGGMTNPMTTQDDLIIGAAAGVAARLAKGANGRVLQVDPSTGHLVWGLVYGPSIGGGAIATALTMETGGSLTLNGTSSITMGPSGAQITANGMAVESTPLDLVGDDGNTHGLLQYNASPSPRLHLTALSGTDIEVGASPANRTKWKDDTSTEHYIGTASSIKFIRSGGATILALNDDGTVSGAPMTTQDDLIIGAAAGVWARLGKGTDGQVLTVDPTTHHILWATPAAAPVTSVAGRTGAVVLANTDISGLGTLATQNGTFSGTHSGTSSGTNTGDQSDATITTTDITTNNVSTSKHGFAPKGDGTITKYLNANGAYSAVAAASTSTPGLAQFATNAQRAASVAVQGNDARFAPWVKMGASQLVAAYGDGDPRTLANLVMATGTPNQQSGIGGVRAQMILFRLPYAFNPAHMYFYGRGTITAALCFAIYPYGTGTTKLWDSGNVDVTINTWTDVTAGSLSGVNLAANTDYWLCCSSTLATNAIPVCEVPSFTGAIAKWGADSPPLGGGLGVGMPVTATIALTAGVFPGTLPTVAASGSSFPPACWFTGTSS